MAYRLWVEPERDDGGSDACFPCRGFDSACAVRVFLDPQRLVGQGSRGTLTRTVTGWSA